MWPKLLNPAQAAGIAALNIKGLEERTLEYIGREKEYLLKNMEILAEKVYGHSANFIFFRESENFGKKMLERGILIRSCRNYYSLNDKYYRIAVRTHNENLKLIKAWKDIKVNG